MSITVMIVDDNQLLLQALCEHLEKMGYDTIIASNGKEALEKLKKEKPDIIIMDIIMPEMNGYEVLAEEMADCWWMFGEGEINYGSVDIDDRKTEYALCSIVSFDSKIQEEIPEITYWEFYNYLQTTQKKPSNSETYLEYLYDVASLDSLEIQSQFKINIKQYYWW